MTLSNKEESDGVDAGGVNVDAEALPTRNNDRRLDTQIASVVRSPLTTRPIPGLSDTTPNVRDCSCLEPEADRVTALRNVRSIPRIPGN